MQFSPSFEENQDNSTKREGESSESEAEPDAAERALKNKSFHAFVKYMKTSLAAGLIVAGVHGHEVQAKPDSVTEPAPKPTTTRVAERAIETDASNREIAKDYIDQNISESLSKSQRTELINQLTEILSTYGAQPINNIYRAEEKPELQTEQTKKPELKVEGFEQLGMSSEKLKKLWSEKHYPNGLIDGEIKSIEYTDSTYAEANDDNVYRQADFNRQKEKLRFFRPQKFDDAYLPSDKVWTFDIIFAHEVSHGADWVANDELSHADRIEFLHDVHEVLDDSFVLGLVNSTYEENADFQDLSPKQRLQVAQEAWANIGELYLSKPQEFKESHPSLYALADKWLTVEDEDFDPAAAQLKRNQLYDSVVDQES